MQVKRDRSNEKGIQTTPETKAKAKLGAVLKGMTMKDYIKYLVDKDMDSK
jgi:hypothetical protein